MGRSKRHTFYQTVRNKVVTGAPASLKCSVICFLCSSDLTGRPAAIGLGNLNTMGAIRPQDHRGQVVALNHKRQCGHGYPNGPESQSRNQNSVTHVDLWHWPIDYGISRREIDRKLTKFLLDMYNHSSR